MYTESQREREVPLTAHTFLVTIEKAFRDSSKTSNVFNKPQQVLSFSVGIKKACTAACNGSNVMRLGARAAAAVFECPSRRKLK